MLFCMVLVIMCMVVWSDLMVLSVVLMRVISDMILVIENEVGVCRLEVLIMLFLLISFGIVVCIVLMIVC